MDDNHQLANAQLRSGGPFVCELSNAGRTRKAGISSPNVQYALLLWNPAKVSPVSADALGNYYAGRAALLERPLATTTGL
ncbi:MAG: hypothetical protein IPI11_14740 [Haliscomenobacter sp.]|nr:hypothetical protein [Haliscomenobacter sp.]